MIGKKQIITLLLSIIITMRLHSEVKLPTLIIITDATHAHFFNEKHGSFTKAFKQQNPYCTLLAFSLPNYVSSIKLLNEAKKIALILLELKMQKQPLYVLTNGIMPGRLIAATSQLLDHSQKSIVITSDGKPDEHKTLESKFKDTHAEVAKKVIADLLLKKQIAQNGYTLLPSPRFISRLYTLNLPNPHLFICCNMNTVKKQINLYTQTNNKVLKSCFGSYQSTQDHNRISNIAITIPQTTNNSFLPSSAKQNALFSLLGKELLKLPTNDSSHVLTNSNNHSNTTPSITHEIKKMR